MFFSVYFRSFSFLKFDYVVLSSINFDLKLLLRFTDRLACSRLLVTEGSAVIDSFS
jgi:hypothetical protein